MRKALTGYDAVVNLATQIPPAEDATRPGRGGKQTVFYRALLQRLADAEDAVQETYLRFTQTTATDLRDVRAWLTTAVARICLDELGSARARHESYVGPWLPEPVVGATGDLAPLALGPEDRVTLDESVSMAMLVLLESLSPAERTAFVLREVLGLPYGEVSEVVGRISPVNGSAGLVFEAGGSVVGVMGFTVAGNLITEIDFVVNPDKLHRVIHRR